MTSRSTKTALDVAAKIAYSMNSSTQKRFASELNQAMVHTEGYLDIGQVFQIAQRVNKE